MKPLDITILGLSITSSWGNGHATTYRALARALADRGHRVLFLERDVSWYADHRDPPDPSFANVGLYDSLDELRDLWTRPVRNSDLVIVGSYVPEGVAVGRWVTSLASGTAAFYDIDTPVTLAKLARRDYEYITPALAGKYDLYLSFTGGPTLSRIEADYGAPLVRPLYCSVDPTQYYAESTTLRYDLGYLGTYSDDRQPVLRRFLLEPARRWPAGRFVVAGPQYPATIRWPANVQRIDHLPPRRHRRFYNSQRFTLNVTRADMVRAGYAPSVRLFEAAACGTPVISDWWPGLDEFFVPGQEILVARSTSSVVRWLQEITPAERRRIGRRARARVLAEHTAARRAEQLEQFFEEAVAWRRRNRRRRAAVPRRRARAAADVALTTTADHS